MCELKLPLSNSTTDGYTDLGLVTQYDYCPVGTADSKTWGACDTSAYITDKTTKCKGNVLSYSCCRSKTNVQLSILGAAKCQAAYGANSTCLASCGSATKLTPSTKTKDCGYIEGTTFKEGVCCSTGPTPTLTPFQPNISATSCLIDGVRYNCEKMMGQTGLISNTPISNTAGVVTPACIPITTQGTQTYRCGYVVNRLDNATACNGLQYVYGMFTETATSADYQCLVGNKGQKKIKIETGSYAGMDGCMLIKYAAQTVNACAAMSGQVSDVGQQ